MPRLPARSRPPQRPRAGCGRRPPAWEAGFSLIELSVVLVLLTIVLGLGLGALNAQFQSANTSLTKKRQDLIREALIAHLGAARRLPCADDPATGGVTGVEDCPASFGVVPYATLGLSRESAEDGWGNLFSYAVFVGPSPTCPGPGIDWKNANCFGEGKAGGYTVNDGSLGAATALTTAAVAVIVSHGANGLGAWTREGTRNAGPVRCEEAHNALSASAGCTLVANTFYRGERQDVDDVVSYLVAGEAIQQLARQGVLKTAPGRMAEDMQAALDTAVGTVVSSGSCGVYTIALPATIDPWGHAYTGDTVNTSNPVAYQISSAGCPTCSPAVAATTRSISPTRLNALLANAAAGFSCP